MNVIALLCSDLHLSHRKPTARAAENCWYQAQARPLKQLCDLQKGYGDCPVIIAGDVFDRWSEPAECINFAMQQLPDNVWAIPGQHDLPEHRYEAVGKSSYFTLVESGKIRTLTPGDVRRVSNELVLVGYPWGFDPEPLGRTFDQSVVVAVIHAYVWLNPRTSYPGAPESGMIGVWHKKLQGFDAAVFGDNHIAFTHSGAPVISNCGCFIRRTQKERVYWPRVGLLYEDGTVGTHEIDCTDDLWIASQASTQESGGSTELHELVSQLESLNDDTSLDFKQAVLQTMDTRSDIPESVRRMILEAMDLK